jgi:hypothetical protein
MEEIRKTEKEKEERKENNKRTPGNPFGPELKRARGPSSKTRTGTHSSLPLPLTVGPTCHPPPPANSSHLFLEPVTAGVTSLPVIYRKLMAINDRPISTPRSPSFLPFTSPQSTPPLERNLSSELRSPAGISTPIRHPR